jgi:hypothetical protein
LWIVFTVAWRRAAELLDLHALSEYERMALMARLFRYLHDAFFSPTTTERNECWLYAGILYAEPSYLSGAARVLDLMGAFDEYNVSDSGDEADRLALRSDWLMLGCDFRAALVTWETEQLGSSERERSALSAGDSFAITQ